ncbi:polysaccharide pyruvyl transferase family protein [Paenibacillus soyae]|uniref:Polysaccharide pyruvyl transferase family protein n=1 Tax=Paenibacillus soyae TaxID=2969249 RepID=A0A9X2MKU6_9BACL|nr:polysaccharide pyruvyl transferase family protein [Paenibacillus soyae]MCR2802511.1 polysaccharide pyruvyl transferase family protein [Paenibacillus soyae]
MKILMFAHDGSLNRGCEAIVRSSASLLKDKIKESKVYLASGRPETDKVIPLLDGIYDGSSMPIHRFSFDWFISSLRVKLFRDESYALGRIHQNIIKHIDDVDVCMSIGGDNYCYGEQPGWYEIDRRVKAKGKKLVLWGCSIGEEDMSEQKLADLRTFDLILTRETLTYEMLKGKGLQNIKLVADPAFTMEKEELALPKGWQQGNTIGINYSPLVWKKNPESKTAVIRLIQHIIDTTDMTIALTPHVIDQGNNDYAILKELFETFRHTGRVILLPDDLTATQYKGYIARMRFFIGARTHATIAAYSNCVPTMVLGYSVKSKGIAKDLFGEVKLVLDIKELSDSKKLLGAFRELVSEEESIRNRLRNVLPSIQTKSRQAAQYIKELV